jgi:hypothetical protein
MVKVDEEKRRIVIVGTPERFIVDNKIGYKIPVKHFDENGDIGDEISYLSVSEEQMMDMIAMAKEMFKDEEADKAYV